MTDTLSLDARHTYGYSSAALDILDTRRARKQAQFLIEKIPHTSHVLDLGCGTGSITVGFYSFAQNIIVTGVDIEPEVIRQAQERAKRIGLLGCCTFVVGDIRQLPFPDESFGAVYSHTVMSQVQYPLEVCEEIYRVLKPGGVVGFREPYHARNIFVNAPARDEYTRLYASILQHNGGNVHVGIYIPMFLEHAGFSDIRVEPVMSTTSSPGDRQTVAQKYARMTREAAFMEQAVSVGLISAEKREKLAEDIVHEATYDFGCISFCMIQTLAWKPRI